MPKFLVDNTEEGLSACGGTFHVKPGDSLEAVRNAVRALPASNRVNGVEVVLAPGRYVFKSTLQFGQEDGGAENQPVVWRSEKA